MKCQGWSQPSARTCDSYLSDEQRHTKRGRSCRGSITPSIIYSHHYIIMSLELTDSLLEHHLDLDRHDGTWPRARIEHRNTWFGSPSLPHIPFLAKRADLSSTHVLRMSATTFLRKEEPRRVRPRSDPSVA